MHRLIVEVDGKLLDLTQLDAAAPYLDRATSVAVAYPEIAETVINYPGPHRWCKGGQDAAEANLPDGWDLPGGKRLQRPGGKENQHKPKSQGKSEVKAQWHLQSSTNQTSPSTPRKPGK